MQQNPSRSNFNLQDAKTPMKPPRGFMCCFTLSIIYLIVVAVAVLFIITR